MKSFQPRGFGHREQIFDQKIERPGEISRRDIRTPTTTHVEGNQPVAIDQRRSPACPDLGAGTDPMMKQDRLSTLAPRRDAVDDVVMQCAVVGRR